MAIYEIRAICGSILAMKPYKQVSQKVLYKNPWWSYRCDRVELPSGRMGEYHFVLTNGSSMVVPQADDGKLLLVRQYRYTGNRDSIEFPCGGLKEGSTHEETAKHELVEETGFLPGRLECVGGFNPCNGLLDEVCRVYIARDLHYVGARPDETESLDLIRLTSDELDGLIRDGSIWDGMTMAAWALARPEFQSSPLSRPGSRRTFSKER
jgi:ADP-ribose pyrophosphatase